MNIEVHVSDIFALALPALEARLGKPIAEWLAEIVEGNLEAEIKSAAMEELLSDLEAQAQQIDWQKVSAKIEEAKGQTKEEKLNG